MILVDTGPLFKQCVQCLCACSLLARYLAKGVGQGFGMKQFVDVTFAMVEGFAFVKVFYFRPLRGVYDDYLDFELLRQATGFKLLCSKGESIKNSEST